MRFLWRGLLVCVRFLQPRQASRNVVLTLCFNVFMPPHMCAVCSFVLSTDRGVKRLDGVRDIKQVRRPHVRSWGLSEAISLYWSTCDSVGTFRHPGNCARLPSLVTPLIRKTESEIQGRRDSGRAEPGFTREEPAQSYPKIQFCSYLLENVIYKDFTTTTSQM